MNICVLIFLILAKVTDEEIAKVEELVNEKIRENIPVVIKEMPKEEALKTAPWHCLEKNMAIW